MHSDMKMEEGRFELVVVEADQRNILVRSTQLFHILVLVVKGPKRLHVNWLCMNRAERNLIACP